MKFATGHDLEPVSFTPQPHSLFPDDLSLYKLTSAVIYYEVSTPLIKALATGHDPKPVPPTSHAHHLIPEDPFYWLGFVTTSSTNQQYNSINCSLCRYTQSRFPLPIATDYCMKISLTKRILKFRHPITRGCHSSRTHWSLTVKGEGDTFLRKVRVYLSSKASSCRKKRDNSSYKLTTKNSLIIGKWRLNTAN